MYTYLYIFYLNFFAELEMPSIHIKEGGGWGDVYLVHIFAHHQKWVQHATDW